MNEATTTKRKLPTKYFHRHGKDKPQDRFQRQDADAVRARSEATCAADPATAKAINVKRQNEHPSEHVEHVSRWLKRDGQRPEVKERNGLK
jgi:hypothetical protein